MQLFPIWAEKSAFLILRFRTSPYDLPLRRLEWDCDQFEVQYSPRNRRHDTRGWKKRKPTDIAEHGQSRLITIAGLPHFATVAPRGSAFHHRTE